ncbi:MAG: Fic family protein [Bacteroidia bacterium]|nr:Fic family protein [Bacteroidia bacterium]
MTVLAQYINPDRTKPWNDLPLLPPPNDLIEDIEIYRDYLVGARAALAELNREAKNIPDQTLLMNTLPLREAKDSSEIENIFTTHEEMYMAFSKLKSQDEVRGAAKEVLRYREALWKGYNYLIERQKFDLNYFINIFQVVKESNLGIRHPSIPTLIRKGGSTLSAGQIVYTPPRGPGVLEQKLQNLVDFINNDETYAYDPLIKMAISHYQFEAIHPFSDGNGRTGRIMNIHILINKSILDLPILYLSNYIVNTKDNYYDLIGSVSQRGKWKDWIKYMLRAVEITAKKTLAKIEDIKALLSATNQRISNEAPNFRYKELIIQAVFSQPYCTVKNLMNLGVRSENTARKRLDQLVNLGILEKKNNKGHSFYVNTPLLFLLSD